MRKIFLLVSFIIIGFCASAQKYQIYPAYGGEWNRTLSKFALGFPNDTTLLHLDVRGYPHWAAIGDSIYRWSFTQQKWVLFEGTGGSTDTTSLSNRINLKLNISDTANKWVTAVRRSNDSVFYQKGGSWTFAYKDSVGSGGGSADGYVDSVRFNRTTNTLTIHQNTAADQSVYLPPSYLDFDSSYTPLGGMRNDSSSIIKSVRIRRNNVTVTPTQVGDSAMYWNIDVPTVYIDSVYREAGKDSIFARYATGAILRMKDSVGTGGGGSTTGVKSIEIVGDSAYLKNDVSADTGNYVYGISGGSRGYKATKKMTFTNPVNGEVVMISADSLINGRKVDTIYRTAGKDSIIYQIAGTRYAIKDSTGAGGGTPGGSNTQVQYNSSGSFAGSSNMTFDGTMLTLPGSSTQSALQAGKFEMQSIAVNNSWFGENVYYNGGWKARANGYTPMIYFPTGAIELQTVSSSVSAGATTTPITRLKIQSNGRVVIGTNVSSLSGTAQLTLSNGSITANSAPLKIHLSGAALMTTPEAGAFEAIVDTLYYTGNAASRSKVGLVTTGSPFLASGTHTPTATNGTNVSASTPGQTQYMRVGNTVTVSGYIEITCTSAGAASQIDLTIPIASAFTNTVQLSGTALEAVTGVASPGHGTISSQATNDRLTIDFTPRATGSLSYRFTYTYQVL